MEDGTGIGGTAEPAPLDIASYLETPEDIAAYLGAVLDLDDPKALVAAIGHAAKAKGMTDIAATVGAGRQSLYRSLSAEGNPSFETVVKVLGALGVRLAVRPAGRDAA